MIVWAKYDKQNKKWKVDEDTCNAFPILRNALKSYGDNAMAYVALIADPTSPFSVFENEEDREAEVREAVFDKDMTLLRPKLVSVIGYYKKLCNTLENRIRESYRNGANNIMKYVNASKIVNGENIKDILSAMKEMPNLIDNISELKKQTDVDNKNMVGKVKSNRKLSWNEERFGKRE